METQKVEIEVPTQVCQLAKEVLDISPERMVEMAVKKYFREVLRACEDLSYPVTVYVPMNAAMSIKDDPSGEKLARMCQDVFELGAATAREILLERPGRKEGNC
jgi:hypothetical protein